MSPRLFALVVSGVLLVVGVIALSVPVKATTTSGTQPCGTGWAVNTSKALHEARVDDLANAMLGSYAPSTTAGVAQDCEDAVSTRRMWAWPLTGIGAIGLLGGLLVRPNRRAGNPPPWAGAPR